MTVKGKFKKAVKCLALVLAVLIALGLAACSDDAQPNTASAPVFAGKPASSPPHPAEQTTGQIYLYGEKHGIDAILEKELELWRGHYNDEELRHLFIETPYFTAEFLNIWMQVDNDDILDAIYEDWVGTPTQVPTVKAFYQTIKAECPETIFHGTDIGHQYDTTGARFLLYLEQNNLAESERYALAQEAIEQGKRFSKQSDAVYRENMMAENFIREFDALAGKGIMGIYGAAHTGLDAMDFTGSVPCMANQLKERYGDAVHSEDLSWMAKDIKPERTDTITINGKEYVASYFGIQDTYREGCKTQEIWRLEDAYEDFKERPKTGNIVPYDRYPMVIETGQVFVLDYTRTDGSVERTYYRSDGNEWEGKPMTEEFTLV